MMYTVTKKRLSPNTVWDVENGKILCRFEKGTFVTDDEQLANKLAAMGHTVVRTDDEADADGQGSDHKPEEDSGDGAGKTDADAGTKNSEDQSQKTESGADTDTGETKKAANRKSRK